MSDDGRYALLRRRLVSPPDDGGTIRSPASGRKVRTVPPRVLPPGESIPAFTYHMVREGDRLDLLAARYLGDPLAFWRICDANDAMNPLELCRRPGRVLRIPGPLDLSMAEDPADLDLGGGR